MESDRVHHTPKAAVLQYILASGYVSRAKLVHFIRGMNHALQLPDEDKLTLDSVRNEAHTVFGVLHMELRELRDDYKDGEQYFALVNKEAFDEPMNKLALPQHLALQLKALLARFFQDSRNPGIRVQNLSATEFPAKDELLLRLAEDKWTIQDGNDRIYPSMRLLYELEPYLCEHFGYKTLFKCSGCEEWLLRGRLCSNRSCFVRLHDRCYDAYFESHPEYTAGECPQCSAAIL